MLDKLARLWIGIIQIVWILCVLSILGILTYAAGFFAWLGLFSPEADWMTRTITIFLLALVAGTPITIWAEKRLGKDYF
ncbi:MAG: hypothetical protein ACWGQW_08115 [bacterium]